MRAGSDTLPVNGRTIVQERRDSVSYFHVELAQHDIILAEGLPVESYLDTGNRSVFENGPGATQLHPDLAATVWEAQGCAPLVVTGAVFRRIVNVLRDRVRKQRRGTIAAALPNSV